MSRTSTPFHMASQEKCWIWLRWRMSMQNWSEWRYRKNLTSGMLVIPTMKRTSWWDLKLRSLFMLNSVQTAAESALRQSKILRLLWTFSTILEFHPRSHSTISNGIRKMSTNSRSQSKLIWNLLWLLWKGKWISMSDNRRSWSHKSPSISKTKLVLWTL